MLLFSFSCFNSLQFTVIHYICCQPDDGPGPLGTDDMLIDASDGQGRGLDLERDASSVYNRLGELDFLASIFSCRNIEIGDLHAILGRVAPFNHPVPASIELDNDSARVQSKQISLSTLPREETKAIACTARQPSVFFVGIWAGSH